MDEYSKVEKSDWEKQFFELVLDLGDSQSERYMKQVTELLREKTIIVPIKESVGHYELGLFDCKFKISHDNGKSFVNIAQIRLGWRKKDKKRYLPAFFAQTEASTIFEDN
jgi:hypothetical protein